MDKLIPIEQSTVWATIFGSTISRVNFFIALTLMLMATAVTYWMFDTVKPYVFDGSQSVILPDPARRGDQMLVKWKVKVNRTCSGSIQRQLFDPRSGVVINYDITAAAEVSEVHGGYLSKTFILPRALAPGWWGYRSRLTYACNPLQHFWPIRYETPDLLFKVDE